VQYSDYTAFKPPVAQNAENICHCIMCLLHFTTIPWPSPVSL